MKLCDDGLRGGREEIRAFAGRFAAQRAAGTQFRHMISNIAVTITGNRTAASAKVAKLDILVDLR